MTGDELVSAYRKTQGREYEDVYVLDPFAAWLLNNYEIVPKNLIIPGSMVGDVLRYAQIQILSQMPCGCPVGSHAPGVCGHWQGDR